jgi:arabinogalactan endo-1,4-beta-galactosidase
MDRKREEDRLDAIAGRMPEPAGRKMLCGAGGGRISDLYTPIPMRLLRAYPTNRILIGVAAGALLGALSACVQAGSTSTGKAVRVAPKAAPSFIVGADISSVQASEDRGVRYSDNGVEQDILQILKAHGFNYARLRVFVDPTQATPRDRPYSAQGYCDLPHTIAMARRIKAAGMGLLIDFHYSDSWADPGKQFTPSAWADLAFDDLVRQLHDYTKDAVGQLKAAGAEPDMVQVGNEITPGMMTDRGGSARNWVQLGALLKAGTSAVKEVDPAILVMLHIDKGGNNDATRNWVDHALAQGVKFDILGESCYSQWQGLPSTWKANFDDLVTRYPKLSFVIAEVAKETRESNDIMHSLPDHRGLGTFIWEPTQNGNGQALFDRQGRVIPAKMAIYDQVVKDFGLDRGKPAAGNTKSQ